MKLRHLTSYDVITNKKWYQFVEQAQGYLNNDNLFRCALTERKPKGEFCQLHHFTTVEVWVSLYNSYNSYYNSRSSMLGLKLIQVRFLNINTWRVMTKKVIINLRFNRSWRNLAESVTRKLPHHCVNLSEDSCMRLTQLGVQSPRSGQLLIRNGVGCEASAIGYFQRRISLRISGTGRRQQWWDF